MGLGLYKTFEYMDFKQLPHMQQQAILDLKDKGFSQDQIYQEISNFRTVQIHMQLAREALDEGNKESCLKAIEKTEKALSKIKTLDVREALTDLEIIRRELKTR